MKQRLLLLLCLLSSSYGALQAQTKHYVKENGTGNGNSWSSAAGDLQKIINNASAGDSIFVAGGTYLPIRRADKLDETSLDDRDNAFVLKKDIKIFGGFAGTEAAFAERDLTVIAHASILSGDIGTANDPSDNTYHVVISQGDIGLAELNGFTIKEAYCEVGGGAIRLNGETIFHVHGGGIYNNASSPKLTNLLICGNRVFSSGGGIYNIAGSSPTLTNVCINGNQAAYGGGIYIENGTTPMILTNLTITGNLGTGIYNASSSIKIRNSIIYNNNGGSLKPQGTATSTMQYSLVENFLDETNGNIEGNQAPEFVLPIPDPALGSAGDYRLNGSSPAINAGNSDYYIAGSSPNLHGVVTDLVGNSRFQKGAIDMGAYESAFNTTFLPDEDGIIYVTATGAGSHQGNSWINAVDNLQQAIDARGVKQVWVGAGTYQPVKSGLSFSMKQGIKIYGSFTGTEEDIADRQFGNDNMSILKGNGASVLRNEDNGLDATALLDGFKITGGNAQGNRNGGSASGGGIYNFNVSPSFSHLTISGNSAVYGGGMENFNAAPRLTDVIISGNSATSWGGGVYNCKNVSTEITPVFTNVIFKDNSTSGNGGGMFMVGTTPRIVNCLFAGNTASKGDAFACEAGNAHMTNTTLVGRDGHSVFYAFGWTFLKNCIVWGNIDGSNYNAKYTLIGSSKAEGGINGNIDARTLNASNIFTDFTGGDFSLQLTSPAKDAGIPTADTTGLNLPPTDLIGHPRIIDGRLDMGAYESPSNVVVQPDNKGIVYVTTTGSGTHKGSNWKNAADDLQKAINASGVKQVWVAAGTYKPTMIGTSFAMKQGVKIYGSFLGKENSLVNRNLQNGYTSILKANGASVIFNDGNGLDTSALLDGFSITGVYYIDHEDGSGIYNNNVSPTYSHLTIAKNTAPYGGGMFNLSSSPVLSHITFKNNEGVISGGAMYNGDLSSPVMTHIIVRHNKAKYGGGIFNGGGSPLMTNVLISDNLSLTGGGGIYNMSAHPISTNVTITNNVAVSGGGIYNEVNSTSTMTNSVIWGNQADKGEEIATTNGSITTLDFCLYKDGASNIYNYESGVFNAAHSLTVSPKFNDGTIGDYKLMSGSPAIDAGTPNSDTSGLNLPPTDILGNSRIANGRIDMGAYEYQDGGALPVTLKNFTGQLKFGVANIQWQSGVEMGFDRYELEKSEDGILYYHWFTQTAKGSNSDYSYHGPQTASRAYYRLKLINNNGLSVYYQKVLSLTQNKQNHLLIYPNPAHNFIKIRVGTAGHISIYDGIGRLVKTQVLTIGINKIDIRQLSSGSYFGVIGGQKITFVKQ